MEREAHAAAPEITGEDPEGFPASVWRDRHPALFQRLKDAFPLSPAQRTALDTLLDSTLRGVMEPLPDDAPGAAPWNGDWDRGHYGKSWTDAPFLWAESYFYRRLRDAFGYHDPEDPWHGVDPFGPFKDAELAGDTVDTQLATLAAAPADELLLAALWGNRADLGFLLTAEEGGEDHPLVADERATLHDLLRTDGRVSLVTDNAGRELVPDLLLAAHLLGNGSGGGTTVRLHVKPHPYYVSDATTADVLATLRRITAAPGEAGRAGQSLWRALEDGRLTLDAHPFFCAPLGYAEMPEDLRADFASSALTLMKGDLNYRRLVGDRHWPATVPFSEVTAYFPGPVAALRTLKSDVATGLAAGSADALDASDPGWRTNGAHALVQARPRPSPVAGGPGAA